jgi:hypothetical protein
MAMIAGELGRCIHWKRWEILPMTMSPLDVVERRAPDDELGGWASER